ncbi:hypothetical protein EVAR_95137_1 [Eumeta japonica]|uniref:Uncharacterized protein n=1 Tax=Eumeta variegata TaxID=151549 RepID=A0A4C1W8I0_EUMVA|nr:hypothetical protein EVAR_95137_1 [Eumeta japonica]
MSLSLMPQRVPEKKDLDRQTDGQQSDTIRVPFFPFEIVAISCNRLCKHVEHGAPLGRAENSRAEPTVSFERFTMTS